jgi:hypothetical protein
MIFSMPLAKNAAADDRRNGLVSAYRLVLVKNQAATYVQVPTTHTIAVYGISRLMILAV